MRKGWSMSLQLGLGSDDEGFEGQGEEEEGTLRGKREG